MPLELDDEDEPELASAVELLSAVSAVSFAEPELWVEDMVAVALELSVFEVADVFEVLEESEAGDGLDEPEEVDDTLEVEAALSTPLPIPVLVEGVEVGALPAADSTLSMDESAFEVSTLSWAEDGVGSAVEVPTVSEGFMLMPPSTLHPPIPPSKTAVIASCFPITKNEG